MVLSQINLLITLIIHNLSSGKGKRRNGANLRVTQVKADLSVPKNCSNLEKKKKKQPLQINQLQTI